MTLPFAKWRTTYRRIQVFGIACKRFVIFPNIAKENKFLFRGIVAETLSSKTVEDFSFPQQIKKSNSYIVDPFSSAVSSSNFVIRRPKTSYIPD